MVNLIIFNQKMRFYQVDFAGEQILIKEDVLAKYSKHHLNMVRKFFDYGNDIDVENIKVRSEVHPNAHTLKEVWMLDSQSKYGPLSKRSIYSIYMYLFDNAMTNIKRRYEHGI